MFNKAQAIKKFLDNGYAVISPNAAKPLFSWSSNMSPWADEGNLHKWGESEDAKFLDVLFTWMPKNGIDMDHLHAGGFS